MMLRRMATTVMLALTAVVAVGTTRGTPQGSAAQAGAAAYFGTWKCDPAKSDLGPLRFRIAERGDEYTLDDLRAKNSYTFRIDGKPYVDPYGYTVAWSSTGPRTWQATYSANGKQVSREVFTLAPGGAAMTIQFSMDSTSLVEAVFTRQAGSGTGLTGEWQGTFVAPPVELELRADGADGVLFRVTGVFEVQGRFDGKPYAMTGSMVTRPSSASFTRSGPRSFKSTQYEGAKQTLDSTFTVSDDGRTLTEAGIADGVKVTLVWGRLR